ARSGLRSGLVPFAGGRLATRLSRVRACAPGAARLARDVAGRARPGVERTRGGCGSFAPPGLRRARGDRRGMVWRSLTAHATRVTAGFSAGSPTRDPDG